MSVCDLIASFVDYILTPGVKVLLAFGFLYFFYGILMYMWEISQGGEGGDGKRHLMWGLLGVTIMLSSGGIIALLINTLKLNGQLMTCDVSSDYRSNQYLNGKGPMPSAADTQGRGAL